MLILHGRIGKTNRIDNLDGEIEITVISVDGEEVTFGVAAKPAPARSYRCVELPTFLKKQAD